LLEGEATFDRRQAAEEMIAELKQESERSLILRVSGIPLLEMVSMFSFSVSD
jgi:hypothetical protein